MTKATKTKYDPVYEARQGRIGIFVYDADSPWGCIQLFDGNGKPMYPTAAPLSAKQMRGIAEKAAKAATVLERLES